MGGIVPELFGERLAVWPSPAADGFGLRMTLETIVGLELEPSIT